jgi:L-lactate dehydrogenase complex protein LldF
MSEKAKLFLSDSGKNCENIQKKYVLSKNLNHFFGKWNMGRSQFSNIQLARKKLHHVRYKNIENLEKNLTEFETKFKTNGGNIFLAPGKNEALQFILQIIQKTGAKKIVKSKSMVCEEIELEDFLKEHDVSVLETDLGEFLVQIAGEKPSHITAPALHKSKIEIYDLLNEKYGQQFDDNTKPEVAVRFVRNLLREEYAKAEVGITGCNFLIANQGAVALTENEANAILSASFPKTHIIVTSVEKIIYSLDTLELFQTMLASHGTGQTITTYNHIISGPAGENEVSGPEEMYLVLINNNRTSIIQDVQMRQATYCIKCGACHNFCPVYRNIGGHAYQSVYNGPIGSVISPYIFGEKEYSFLPFASTLCGKCNDVCPVNINLTSLLVHKRRNIVVSRHNSASERRAFSLVNKTLMKRKRMDRYPAFIKNTALKLFMNKTWGKERELPVFSGKSFNKVKKAEKK